MNKKRIWLIIPTALLPYLALFALALVLLSAKWPAFGFIMESVFDGNAVNLIASVVVYCIIAATLSILCFFTSIRKGWDALSLAKSAMIIKLIQLPAYALIFVAGIFLVITIFTIPFSLGLVLLDCLTLFLTGLLTAAAGINSVRQGVFKTNEIVLFLALQLVFCADVVVSIIFYLKLRKKQ